MSLSEITAPNLLLVEGKDEVNFFDALLRYMGYGGDSFHIVDAGGKSNIKNELKTLTKLPGFTFARSLGIVRDADDNPSAAFESVKDALQGATLPVPSEPLKVVSGEPSEVAPSGIRTAVYIMPDGSGTPGALENLCISALDSEGGHSRILDCARNFFRCTESEEPFDTKAVLQVAFSWFNEPVPNVGLAAKKSYLPLNSSAFENLRGFINMLFL